MPDAGAALTVDNVRNRCWRGYADALRVLTRRGSARPATSVFAGVDRSDHERWSDETARRHDEYREANPIAAGRVAVVCVTNRPHFLQAVAENVQRQAHDNFEFVLVTNADGFDEAAIDAVSDRISSVGRPTTRIERPPEVSLGECLNAAMAATDARFIAKFDDDDLYGPEHLNDSLRAHGYSGAAVVGKHTYFAHLESDDETILRFPGHEFTYSSTLAGGTLVIDRDRTSDLEFAPISLGEDGAFIRACHRRGLSTFAADRFSYVQRRSADNSWNVSHDDFRRNTIHVAGGLPSSMIHI